MNLTRGHSGKAGAPLARPLRVRDAVRVTAYIMAYVMAYVMVWYTSRFTPQLHSLHCGLRRFTFIEKRPHAIKVRMGFFDRLF